MKRILTWWRRVCGVSSSVPRLLAVTVAPEWTPDEARQWQTFLRSPAGQTLWQRARARQAALCVEACDGKFDPKMAAGFTFTLNWLEQLANAESISGATAAQVATTEAGTHEDAGFSPETSFA